jgi:phosphatidylserine/phosphatidylglycerophosphate/cardiolipin synthase-like enzyme
VTGVVLPRPDPPPAAGELTVQAVRTVPEKIYDAVPRGEFRILESYVRALRAAKKLVYLESQFLWSPELVAVLSAKLRQPPADDFRLVVLLPAKPNNGADETRGQLGVLADADGGAGRLLACTLYQRGDEDARPVYVHAKIGIVDDEWLTIGSANLNEHSLFNDTELNVICCDRDLVRETRLRLWAEHLDRPTEEVSGDPTHVIDEVWRPLAEEQLARREADAPLTHKLLRLPHVSRRTRRLLGPLQGFVVDG